MPYILENVVTKYHILILNINPNNNHEDHFLKNKLNGESTYFHPDVFRDWVGGWKFLNTETAQNNSPVQASFLMVPINYKSCHIFEK